MAKLRRTQFGNPVLRQVARRLTPDEIRSSEIQQLILAMRQLLDSRRYGVGLAAPQVGKSLAISVIGIKPTPTRPHRERQELVIVNPEIVTTYGRRTQLWEGCISFGDGNFPYAKVPRYRRIRLRYMDEQGAAHEQDMEGILAHVVQHEVDHLNGILFVDRVKDTTSYVTIQEYKRRYMGESRKR